MRGFQHGDSSEMWIDYARAQRFAQRELSGLDPKSDGAPVALASAEYVGPSEVAANGRVGRIPRNSASATHRPYLSAGATADAVYADTLKQSYSLPLFPPAVIAI
jgi:hypothetical protein